MIRRPLPKSYAYQDQRKHTIIVCKTGRATTLRPFFLS